MNTPGMEHSAYLLGINWHETRSKQRLFSIQNFQT